MMVIKQSDRVREIFRSEYVEKALAKGETRFQVSARDVLHRAEEDPDFPRARTPLICNVLQSKKLLAENDLEIERIEGPESRQSRRVVVHYAFRKENTEKIRGLTKNEMAAPTLTSVKDMPPAARVSGSSIQESAAERAKRVTDGLRGLLKDEIGQYGGTEAFIRWVRSEEDEAA